jgi:nitroreductase
MKMETLEAIATRRSNRRFKPDPIPQDVLEKILNAGIMAPSGKNRQSWRFVVLSVESWHKKQEFNRQDAKIAKSASVFAWRSLRLRGFQRFWFRLVPAQNDSAGGAVRSRGCTRSHLLP